MIDVYSNRKVTPEKVIIANQHENLSNILEFNFHDLPNGYLYLILTKYGKSHPYLITDNKVDITSQFTWKSGGFEANIVISDEVINDVLDSTHYLWISNTFVLYVKSNSINADSLQDLPIPPDLKMPYDELIRLIDEVNAKLENGEFNGKDGVGIKSIEKTGSEGLIDTYTITFTDETTIKYTVRNGADGKDGEPGNDGAPGITPNIQIGTVTTLEPGQQATVERTGTNENPFFNFGIPKGEKGESGGSTADALQFAVKETAEGNPVVISDSADWENQGFELYGQSEQPLLKSYNLFPEPLVREVTNEQGSFKRINEDGSITIKNVANSPTSPNDWCVLSDKNIFDYHDYDELPAGSYSLYIGGESNNPNKTVEVLCQLVDQTIVFDRTNLDKGWHDFTIDKTQQMRILIRPARTNEDYENTIYFMITTMENKGKPFVKYGTSEITPDTPSDVISKEVSKIKFTGSNLIPSDAIQITQNNIYSGQEKGIYLQKGIKYVYSCTTTGKNPSLYFIKLGEFDAIHRGYNVRTLEFTPTESGLYYLNLYDETGITQISDLRLNIGEDYGYEPYKEQVVNLTEPITLRGIPVDNGGNVTIDGQQYVSDVLREKDGVIGVERSSIKIDYTGSDKWAFYSDIYKGFYTNNKLPETMQLRKGFSNILPVSSDGSSKDGVQRLRLGGANTVTYLLFSQFYDDSLDDYGASKWMDYLKENPMTVITYVTNPTFEPLPEADQEAIRKLKTFYPNTVIDANCFTKIKYVADTKLYIDKKINEVVSTVSNIQNVLIGGQYV